MKFKNFALGLALTLAVSTFAQKGTKKETISNTNNTGSITYEFSMPDDPQGAMMGTSTFFIAFENDKQVSEMIMMGGMVDFKTINLSKDIKDTKLLFNVMGKKYEVTNVTEEGMKTAPNKNPINLDKAISITYDKKDTKEILGYTCYKAEIKYEDNNTSTYYITEKIALPAIFNTNEKVKLVGFPLEMIFSTEKAKILFKATEYKKEVGTEVFVIPTDYKKVTMEEFQQEMGAMGGGN